MEKTMYPDMEDWLRRIGIKGINGVGYQKWKNIYF